MSCSCSSRRKVPALPFILLAMTGGGWPPVMAADLGQAAPSTGAPAAGGWRRWSSGLESTEFFPLNLAVAI